MARFYSIMDVVGLDVKLGLRLMRKSWGLTLVGGVAMALTIGLGTAIFTLWNTATTTTLPLPDGDRIVAIQSSDAATQQIHRDSSLPDFRRWRELLRSVTDVSAMRLVERTLITPGGASGPISVAEMTASAFRLARVQPVLGRPLIDDDERGGANVVVIGFELWQAGFSSDPAVLGRRLQLDDVSYTVVGVMPREFAFPVSQRIWIPLRTNPSEYSRDQPPDVFVFARLAPGFTLESAQAEVVTLGLAQDRVARPNEQTRYSAPCRPVCDGPVQHRREQALDRQRGPVDRGCCCCSPLAQTSRYWSTRGPSRDGRSSRRGTRSVQPEAASSYRFSSRHSCSRRQQELLDPSLRASSPCGSRDSSCRPWDRRTFPSGSISVPH